MTKSQIKAELRRSACDKSAPMFADLSQKTFDAVEEFLPIKGATPWDYDGENKRFFFLFCAEAI